MVDDDYEDDAGILSDIEEYCRSQRQAEADTQADAQSQQETVGIVAPV